LDEEISKQEEARRILDTIRHKEESDGEEQNTAKPISYIAEEDANQLKALIAQKWKLKNEAPSTIEELPEPENIDPISTEQIKVMRKFAAVQEDEKKPLKTTILDSIIKFYFEIADSFKLQTANTRSCFNQGHECVHCAKKIPFAALEEYEKAANGKAAKSKATRASASTSKPEPK